MQKIKQDKLVVIKQWYDLIKTQFSHLSDDNISKISDYCLQHSNLDNKNKIVSNESHSLLPLAIKTLVRLSESKVKFEVAKYPQREIILSLTLTPDYLEKKNHQI